MFLGHFGLAFGAKQGARATSLGTLFAAAQFADLLWPILLLTGVERVRIDPGITVVTPLDFEYYPYSHSLVLLLVWGGLFGFAYSVIRRVHGVVALIGGLVASHWMLDLVVHRPDLPFTPWTTSLHGEGLWNSLPATVLVESVIFLFGVTLYARATRARDRAGLIGLWVLVVILALIWIGSVFGPPPPSEAAIAWAGNAMWLFVALAYYVDRHREPRPVG